ncbi:putative cysteine-rich receptor-like protein kinase 12 [Rosa chinensis]|uniref:putative cysteine-rich receptor-like protein kinase 12 n=1 Tax=Rosa chinensis TaxID=74649 RepID=UPI001AD922C2|nr:putative cysteine-rich receptor-like protein kinase 12 [Rosa chinensis]
MSTWQTQVWTTIYLMFLTIYGTGSSSDLLLDWSKCFNIIEGIAQGLFYLHKYSRLLIHNVKASNVLLDAQMYPKVADFGLAKICADDEETVETAAICGTMGYMAPEYLITGILSMKTCGSKATCASYFMLKFLISMIFLISQKWRLASCLSS